MCCSVGRFSPEAWSKKGSSLALMTYVGTVIRFKTEEAFTYDGGCVRPDAEEAVIHTRTHTWTCREDESAAIIQYSTIHVHARQQ